MMRFLIAVAVFCWAGAAGADLYRWIDRDTGSVKFSSYPPPWYGDPAQERRAPKVEVIPAGKAPPPAAEEMPLVPATPGASPATQQPAAGALAPPARPRAPATPGGENASLDNERRQILQSLNRLAAQGDAERSVPVLRRELDTYQALTAEMDRRDPMGASGRRAEAQALVERLQDVLRAAGMPR